MLLININIKQIVKIMTTKIDGKNLVITIPMNPEPMPSTSGKTLVVASSKGNRETEAIIDGKKIIVGLNAYIKKD